MMSYRCWSCNEVFVFGGSYKPNSPAGWYQETCRCKAGCVFYYQGRDAARQMVFGLTREAHIPPNGTARPVAGAYPLANPPGTTELLETVGLAVVPAT